MKFSSSSDIRYNRSGKSTQSIGKQAMNQEQCNLIIDFVKNWAKSNPNILAAGLCGSWARPDSDLDLGFGEQRNRKYS